MKKKNTTDIHQRKKCAKFKPNPTIFEISRLPQSIWDKHTQIFSDSSSTEVENYIPLRQEQI